VGIDRDELEMTHTNVATSIVIFVTILSFPFNVSQSEETDPIEALKSCARTANTEDRYACYDTLGKRVLGEEAELSESSAVSAEAPAVVTVVVAETAAEENVFKSVEDEKNKPIYGHVRSCQQASDNRWFFIFDSGNVWKQTGGKSRRFEDCDFDVVIHKDFIGYKMTIDGDDQRVRVRRHK